MDDEDIFDAFGNEASEDAEDCSKNNAEDKNSDDTEKQNARESAAALLDSMMNGNMGAVGYEDDEPAVKRARIAPEAVAEDIELEPTHEHHHFSGTTVHKVQTSNQNCTHEVVVPKGVTYTPLVERTTPPAKTYPFQLDSFQREAILCIENSESVLVSAHTSAGKTVVALYAIAQCLRDRQRVIYTSPIKALSNQKYRELSEEFEDVGLMTGDVTLNPDASCLVMTTEILRSMLYRGSEVIREVGWIIFDEIHYMRDQERGVVWEETIILLPDNVHHAFLSATIPNAIQFAKWVCALHNQPCHVVYTDYRPTPLQHFIFPAGGEAGLYEVVNMKGEFRNDKFEQAMSGLVAEADNANSKRRPKGIAESNVMKIIRTIKERDMLPCIVFSFSRKECEAYALSLKDMDFNTEEEKRMVAEIYNSAVDLLSDEDKKLPQIGQILPLLKRGIGVHHSGLLPILKETTEILFGEGLIKNLFATETFSMGLNMPARTVLFTSARKYDGKDFRWITSGEYIQMSGRAGRRGKDDRGLVILMVDQKMSNDDAKQIIKGNTDPLNSQFRLTYNMVLNLLRVEGVNPEFMLERSFYQYQVFDNIPNLIRDEKRLNAFIENSDIEAERDIAAYHKLKESIDALENRVIDLQFLPRNCVPFLAAGRFVKIIIGEYDYGWCPLVNYQKRLSEQDATVMEYVVQVCVDVDVEYDELSFAKPAKPGQKSETIIMNTKLLNVRQISAVRIKMPVDMTEKDSINIVASMTKAIHKKLNGNFQLLDPLGDMKISDPLFKAEYMKLMDMKERYKNHPLKSNPNFYKMLNEYQEKRDAEVELKSARDGLKQAKKTLQLEKLDQMKSVLRRLQYCNKDNVVEAKGRVACELSASDELVLTEMLFSGVFNNLTVGQIAALMSCFVFQENAAPPRLAEELSGCLRNLQEYARRIAKISNECKLDMIEEEYVEKFKPGLMDVVHNWVEGMTFGEIMNHTDVFEGSIIRCLRRLEEVLREMVNAAKAMSNAELGEKLEEARKKIKRDIVFAASLYL